MGTEATPNPAEQPTRHYRGDRWTDSTKIIWSLFGLLGFIGGLWLSSLTYDLRDHEKRIQAMEVKASGETEWRKNVEATLQEIRADVKALRK